MLQAMREKYRQIRREVYHEATRPDNGDADRHAGNRQRLRTMVECMCARANLDHYRTATPQARTALWHHLWTKNRYAGIKAATATAEIHGKPNDKDCCEKPTSPDSANVGSPGSARFRGIKYVMDDFRAFSSPGWDIETNRHQVIAAGPLARDFLDRTGDFKDTRAVGNVPKLRTLVNVARKYAKHADDYPDLPALEFVTRGHHEDAVWDIHRDLMDAGYRKDLTTLHFMMDVGFQVIKPDLVVSRLFLDWGWLHHAAPGLPPSLSRQDLLTKPKYQYFKPRIYKPIIDLAREIVQGIDRADLVADIGWATDNPLREFDAFLVKAGQMPEPDYGIERRLYP